MRAGIGCLLVAAAVVLLLALGRSEADNNVLAILALQPDRQWVESGALRPTRAGSYRASLILDESGLERGTLECLVGVKRRGSVCAPELAPVSLDWTLILRSGGPMGPQHVFGDSAGEYSKGAVGRSLGSYDLARGDTYALRARLLGGSARMWSMHPKIRLELDSIAYPGLILQSLGLMALAVLSAVTGLWLLWPFFRNRLAETGWRARRK